MKNSTRIVVTVGLLAAGACAAQQPPPLSQAKAAAVSDAEIAAIVVAANSVDAEAGDLAADRANSRAIKQFGKTMGTDHRAVNKAAVELVTRLKVTPVESETSRQLSADGVAFRADLKTKAGGEFDRAYIAHEVAYHKAVIAALDDLLIPSAQNVELKNTLIGVRPAFVAHLEHAEHLLADLK